MSDQYVYINFADGRRIRLKNDPRLIDKFKNPKPGQIFEVESLSDVEYVGMTDAEKLRLAVETLRNYADSENWGRATNGDLRDMWWPLMNGYDLARQTLKKIEEELCPLTKNS